MIARVHNKNSFFIIYINVQLIFKSFLRINTQMAKMFRPTFHKPKSKSYAVQI